MFLLFQIVLGLTVLIFGLFLGACEFLELLDDVKQKKWRTLWCHGFFVWAIIAMILLGAAWSIDHTVRWVLS